MPRKRFGQHFLHDQTVLQAIVAAIAPQKNQHLLEIGPGEGVLTELLLPRCQRLDAIEIDRDLCRLLEKKLARQTHFFLHEGDVLRFDFHPFIDHFSIRIVGNLPYQISTPLLFTLFPLLGEGTIQDMIFLLQKEVVERLCAEVGSADYGRLSVMAQYYCACENLLAVPPQAFTPPPRVESALVRLQPHHPQPYIAHDITRFSHIVKEAFTYRRKTLSNALKNVITKEQLTALNIDSQKRPQDLSVAEYVRISNQA